MKLSSLHESFIDKARRPMSFGRLPISPVQGDIAIIPVDKWVSLKEPSRLKKTYNFLSKRDRNNFVVELFDYEKSSGHSATIKIQDDSVELVLFTKNLDQITEIDKEYARFADELFKDIVYNPVNEP